MSFQYQAGPLSSQRLTTLRKGKVYAVCSRLAKRPLLGYHIFEPGRMELCIFPLNTVLFPGHVLPLQVFEPRYKKMMGRVLGADGCFGITLIRRGLEVGGPAEPFEVGTVARVVEAERQADGRLKLLVRGEQRFRLRAVRFHRDGYLVGDAELLVERPEDPKQLAALAAAVRDLYLDYLRGLAEVVPFDGKFLPEDPGALAHWVAATLPIDPLEKQRLLELDWASQRLTAEIGLLRREQALADRVGYLGARPPDELSQRLVGRNN